MAKHQESIPKSLPSSSKIAPEISLTTTPMISTDETELLELDAQLADVGLVCTPSQQLSVGIQQLEDSL